jgi:hypothetical protein
MNEVDKAYMNKEMPEPYDPNPADEVFASVKELIVALVLVVLATLLVLWGLGKL